MEADNLYLNTAEFYDLQTAGTSYYEEQTQFCLSLVNEEVAAIVDLGCGTGTISLAVARTGRRVVGVDLSEKMLEIARIKRNQIIGSASLEFVTASICEFYRPENFDLAFMIGGTFAGLVTDGQRRSCLANIRRSLRSHGRLAFDAFGEEFPPPRTRVEDRVIWSRYFESYKGIVRKRVRTNEMDFAARTVTSTVT